MEGKIVLVVFPQDKEQKLRPALVLKEFPKFGDLLICGISTQLHQFIVDFDLLLDEANPNFADTGLKATSICRLSMLTMLPKNQVRGIMGKVSPVSHRGQLKKLADYLISE